MSQDRLQRKPLLYPLKLERQDRCCLINLLSILEGRHPKWTSADCCDKIEAALEYVCKHAPDSHSGSVHWIGGRDDDEKGWGKRDPSGKEIIAVYPGRFQPMGKHHKATYDWMVKEFGEENSFIVTGDKVRPDSPLTFAEKQQVAQAMGIPAPSIKKEKIVYSPPSFSFMEGRTPQNTAVIVVVGEKDMKPSFDPKKNKVMPPRFVQGKSLDAKNKKGEWKYYRTYDPGLSLEGFDQHGYIIVAPHQEFDIGGIEMSGTALRSALPTANDENFKDWLNISDPDTIKMLRTKLSDNKV